jgi:uncharacterized membrane protein
VIARPITNVVFNLFLALIPVVLAFVVFAGIRRQRANGARITWIVWIPMLFMWLVFLPNTCYLVTEWRHYLHDVAATPDLSYAAIHTQAHRYQFVLNTLFYLLYTNIGLTCFYLAIYPIDRLFKPRWLIRPVFFFLCSLGVYLGLVDRLNSWQVIKHPRRILFCIGVVLHNPSVGVFMIGFAAALWFLYGLFGLTMDGIRLRYRAIRPARK